MAAQADPRPRRAPAPAPGARPVHRALERRAANAARDPGGGVHRAAPARQPRPVHAQGRAPVRRRAHPGRHSRAAVHPPAAAVAVVPRIARLRRSRRAGAVGHEPRQDHPARHAGDRDPTHPHDRLARRAHAARGLAARAHRVQRDPDPLRGQPADRRARAPGGPHQAAQGGPGRHPRLGAGHDHGAGPGLWARGPATGAVRDPEPREPRLRDQGDAAVQDLQTHGRYRNGGRHLRGRLRGRPPGARPRNPARHPGAIRRLPQEPVRPDRQVQRHAAGHRERPGLGRAAARRGGARAGRGRLAACGRAAPGPGPRGVRWRRLRLPARGGGAARRELRRRAGRDRGARGQERRRQVHHDPAAAAVLRPAAGCGADRRPRLEGRHARIAQAPDHGGPAGCQTAPEDGARDDRVREAGRHGTGDRARRAARASARVHHAAAAGLRHAGRGGRRQPVGRRAPAPQHRPRNRARHSDRGARRAVDRARRARRGQAPAGARRAHARQDGDRDRARARHVRRRRPHRAAPRRARGRDRNSRRTAPRLRRVPRAVRSGRGRPGAGTGRGRGAGPRAARHPGCCAQPTRGAPPDARIPPARGHLRPRGPGGGARARAHGRAGPRRPALRVVHDRGASLPARQAMPAAAARGRAGPRLGCGARAVVLRTAVSARPPPRDPRPCRTRLARATRAGPGGVLRDDAAARAVGLSQ